MYLFLTSNLLMTLLFCESRDPYINTIRIILQCFENIMGLKVNLEKSSVLGLNLNEVKLFTCAQLLGCQKEQWSLKFLVLPLGGNPGAPEFWSPVVEKMAKRLSTWKKNCLFGRENSLDQIYII